jgi:hypothetical protein
MVVFGLLLAIINEFLFNKVETLYEEVQETAQVRRYGTGLSGIIADFDGRRGVSA